MTDKNNHGLGNPWTTTELSEASGVSMQYIGRLLNQGRLRGQKIGHMWAIPDSEAQRFIEEREEERLKDHA